MREDNLQRLCQFIRMPGQQYDEESGLYYNRNRYYNPGLGRYITQDPIGLEGASRNLTDGATDEAYLHMSVSVGKWGQVYSSYSFGSSFLLYGEVYKDPYPNGLVLQYKKQLQSRMLYLKKKWMLWWATEVYMELQIYVARGVYVSLKMHRENWQKDHRKSFRD